MDVLRYGITARTVPSRRGMIAADFHVNKTEERWVCYQIGGKVA